MHLPSQTDTVGCYKLRSSECAKAGGLSVHLPRRSGPCDNIFTRKKPSAAVK
jgi:hypothetical protein